MHIFRHLKDRKQKLFTDADIKSLYSAKDPFLILTSGLDKETKTVLRLIINKYGNSALPVETLYNGVKITSQRTVNAQVNFHKKHYCIFLSLPILKLCWLMSKVFATRMEISEIHNQALNQESFSGKETRHHFITLMDAFWRDTIIHSDVLSKDELDGDKLQLALTLSLLSRRFILGHEIGHALIYYSRNQCKEMLYLARENALSIMKILSEVGFTYAPRSGKRNRRKVLSSWSEEFAADAIGLGLAIEAAEDARIQHLTVLAVEETLTTIALAEFFWPVTQLGMKPYICHHPFGIVRSKNLRRCFAPNCPESVLNVGPEFFDHLFWDQVKSWWH